MSGFRNRLPISNQNRNEQMFVGNLKHRSQHARLFGFRKNDASSPGFGAGANVFDETHDKKTFTSLPVSQITG
jgi:hypothetical protein